MSDPINHFIWGYQRYFRFSAESAAKHLFEKLYPSLEPEVFLVAVRITESEDYKQACVEPEEEHWLNSEELYDVLDDVNDIQESYPESQIHQSHPVAQKNSDDYLFRRALRDAIQTRLEGAANAPTNKRFFLSFPVEKGPFLVIIVLELASAPYGKLLSISRTEVKIHEYRRFNVPANLVEATAQQFLLSCTEELVQPNAGMSLGISRSNDEILRSAGISFFRGLLNLVDRESLIAGMGEVVFDAVSRVSFQPYEGAETHGHLLIGSALSETNNQAIELREPIALGQTRALRKLLVLANSGLYLLSDSRSVHAISLGAIPSAKEHVQIAFAGRGRWSVSINDSEVMVVQDRIPSLPQKSVAPNVFTNHLQRIFPVIATRAIEQLLSAITAVADEEHGAVIVITEDAAEESVRLAGEGFLIAPVCLEPKTAKAFSRIDGAVICSTDGMCHAFGVILDGLASAGGNRSRGARYNSAVRYVTEKNQPTVAVILSEDGGIDFIPKLKPQIPKTLINSRLDELRGMAKTENSSRRKQSQLIDWFEKHSYYLNSDECEQVNELIERIDQQHSAIDPDAPRIIRKPIMPDPSFVPDRDLY